MTKLLITEERYLKLLQAESTLDSLNNAGVDNWEGDADYDTELLDAEELPDNFKSTVTVWTMESHEDIGAFPPCTSKKVLEEQVKEDMDLTRGPGDDSYEEMVACGAISYTLHIVNTESL